MVWNIAFEMYWLYVFFLSFQFIVHLLDAFTSLASERVCVYHWMVKEEVKWFERKMNDSHRWQKRKLKRTEEMKKKVNQAEVYSELIKQVNDDETTTDYSELLIQNGTQC